MVAGASGIDFALLLIAADDGIMPQTIEHLSILSLLHVRRGAAVITKIDRVDESVKHERITQVQALLAEAGLNDYPVLCVSALRGDGVDDLRSLLQHEAEQAKTDVVAETAFRMGLDRAFTLDGVGTVVAGSIATGIVHVGDSLCLAHAPDKSYRVRSLHVHNKNVETAHAGQRCAVGLVGLERNVVERGHMLCDPAIAQSSLRMDVFLQVAATEASSLRSGTLVHLHLATQECMASVAILGSSSIVPGESGLAQLVVQQPINAWHGDRFILRDASANRTVAGGSVLDTNAPARYRQTPQRLNYLQTQRSEDPATRLQGALAHAPFGLNSAEWLRSAGLHDWPFTLDALDNIVFGLSREWAISQERLQENEAAVINALQAFHTKYPEDIGPDLQRARRLAAPRMPEALWQQLIARMATNAVLAKRNGFLHLAEHGVQLQAAEKIVAERALPLLLEGSFDPPWIRDIADAIKQPETQVRHIFIRLAKAGDVFQIVKDLYYHPLIVRKLAALVRNINRRDGEVTAANFRDATGLGRKRAIQILEFFDRIGFLRRVDDKHLLRPGTVLFPEGE
ncbi:selenocysteine-specific translation elongation factor [Herminiimonas arsenitoxidans]|uniref:selenocysteine-specific translation elongation factor n=1 Tax=Herminiimonas arsenitoxidans TaxID=1809410 RepID=UPI0022B26A5A|nr:selenocysteine-specific translation elongation factor [Herminiimonas arsenitoxidans]